MKRSTLIASVLAVGFAAPALAHHPLGGATPSTLTHGLLSGFGHPVIGIDHLAFVIAMGIAAAFTAHRAFIPLAFVVATIAGCLLTVAGVQLPLAELVITGSVIVVGSMILSGRQFSAALFVAIFAFSGVFHGWAYGASILGAQTTPLVAYLIGFGLIQYVIALGSGLVARRLWLASGPSALNARLAGALATGIGVAFFLEHIEGIVFA